MKATSTETNEHMADETGREPLSLSQAWDHAHTPPPKPGKLKMWAARIVLLIIFLTILGGCTLLALRAGGWFIGTANGSQNNPDPIKLEAKAKEIAHYQDNQDKLPETGILASVGLGWISPDQKSNEKTIENMTQELGSDISQTDAMEPIRALRKLRGEMDPLRALKQSDDPAIQANAALLLAENGRQQNAMEEEIHRRFQEKGVNLTREQVKSLGASPNAEDITAMIAAFATLKEVNAQMEAALRKNPSQEMAQEYYGAHTILLSALDHIQKTAMDRIEKVHLKEAEEIGEIAKETAENARKLLRSNEKLSENERVALNWNIQSCGKTVEISHRTQAKLKANLAIISKANEKLAGSIATAENCHMTAKLQRAILSLENSGEIAKIEALTVPQLAAVNFADPENLEVSE